MAFRESQYYWDAHYTMRKFTVMVLPNWLLHGMILFLLLLMRQTLRLCYFTACKLILSYDHVTIWKDVAYF